jgi:hypothetical protein
MRLEDKIIYLAFSKKNANILLKGAVLGALIYRYSAMFKPLSIKPPLVRGQYVEHFGVEE